VKRAKNLYADVCDFGNLLCAAEKALRGKRRGPAPSRFLLNLETELCLLQEELMAQTYRPGAYREFEVCDPKRRLVSAAPFRDRVVHHALCNVIEPIFDRAFVYDSYACRQGKGTHAAADRATHYMRRHPYALQCDISDYFASIDHEVLLGLIRRKIGCPETLWLIERILHARGGRVSEPTHFPGDTLFTPLDRPRGLPLGNQTSQFFANVYLDPLDHYIKEVLRIPGYVRYADDFVLFADDKATLWDALDAIRRRLWGLRLLLNPRKTHVQPVHIGMEFLGYRVFPDHRRLRRDNPARFRRRLRSMAAGFAAGEVPMQSVHASVRGWLGHAMHADTWGLRRAIFGEVPLTSPRA